VSTTSTPPTRKRGAIAAQSARVRRAILTERDSHHPVVVGQALRHAEDLQLRIADAVTSFAGSMPFVYLHAVLFAVWMIFFERSPWPTLTLVVSLEAIFLSTFVMIGQNRQASFQQAKADHDFAEQEQELKLNTQVTRAIHALAQEIHEQVCVGNRPTD